jgi:hypothetical protein
MSACWMSIPNRIGADFVSALPEFAKINDAAYWDYQRDKIYVRSNASLRGAAKRKRRNSHRALPVNITVNPSRPRNCPACNSTRVTLNGRRRRKLFDMRFSNGCIRRWIIRYIIDYYKCTECCASFAADNYNLERSPYSANVLAYVIYSIIEVRISQYKLLDIMKNVWFCFRSSNDKPNDTTMR